MRETANKHGVSSIFRVIRYYRVAQITYIVQAMLDRDAMMNADEIAALALVLQAHTPMERLSNMETRSILEYLRGLQYLSKPKAAA